MPDKTAKGSSLTLFASPEWRSRVPWPLLTTLGALVAALAGWLVVVAYAFLGWMEVPEVPLIQPLGFAAQIWSLAHGASIRLAGGVLSIPPLGLSLLLMIVVSGVAGWIGGQIQLTSASARGSWLVRIAGLFTIEYVIIVTAVAASLLGAKIIGPVMLGAALIGASSFVSVSRSTGFSVHDHLINRLPTWAAAVPKAIGAGILLMLGSSALVLAIALFVNRERVTFLQDSLGAGNLGIFLVVVGQLAYLPNLVLWASGWITGAGVSLGTETIMSPVANQVGLLPTIPLFGIVPETGAAPWYHLLCLAIPVAIGITTAWAVLSRAAKQLDVPPRADFTALLGGVVALVVGVCVSLLAVIAGGDLGEIRLLDLGVRWPAMIIITPTLLGFAGLFTGLAMGLRATFGKTSKNLSQSVSSDSSLPTLETEGVVESEETSAVDETSEIEAEELSTAASSTQQLDETDDESSAAVTSTQHLDETDEPVAPPIADDAHSRAEIEEIELEETVVLDSSEDALSTDDSSDEPGDPESWQALTEDEAENTEDVIAKLVQSVENAYRRDAGLDER